MSYELKGEVCSSYEILRQRLKSRGFTNISMGASSMLQMASYSAGPIVDTKHIKSKNIMIQRGQKK